MGWEGSEEELAGGTFFQSAEIFDRESRSTHLPFSALLTLLDSAVGTTLVLSPVVADALCPWIRFAHEEPRHSLPRAGPQPCCAWPSPELDGAGFRLSLSLPLGSECS